MATVPTGRVERELRAYFRKWLQGLSPAQLQDSAAIDLALADFSAGYQEVMEKWGGQAARQGFRAGFPAPTALPLSGAVPGHVMTGMQQAMLRAGIASGTGARTLARDMLRAGVTGEFYKVERLARTEVVRAYWGNARAQARELGMVLVWSSEDGPRTCPSCKAKDGLVVDDPTVYDHPNGRCTLIPTLPQLLEDSSRALVEDKPPAESPEGVPYERPYAGLRWDDPAVPAADRRLLERFWQFHDGPDQTDHMWSDTHEGMRVIRREMAAQKRGGHAVFDHMDRDGDEDAWRFFGMSEKTFDFAGATPMTTDQIVDAVRLAAKDLASRQAVQAGQPLYRGMWLSKDLAESLAAGRTFDMGELASFATTRQSAVRYAVDPSAGAPGGKAVIFEITDAKGIKIRDDDWGEWLVSGKVRIEEVIDTSARTGTITVKGKIQ